MIVSPELKKNVAEIIYGDEEENIKKMSAEDFTGAWLKKGL